LPEKNDEVSEDIRKLKNNAEKRTKKDKKNLDKIWGKKND
jgi:hypothetical protein